MAPPIEKTPEPEKPYTPRDTLANTASSTLQTTVAGAIIAGTVNTLTKRNVGPWGVITKSGGIIALYATVGATFQLVSDSAANLRQKDDPYNEAIGGFVAGSMIGVARRSMPFMVGAGVGTAVTMYAYKYTGGIGGFMSNKYNDNDDRVEQKEEERKKYRRPISETIELLGEGRGIYAPGYGERRRERLMKAYGVDVGPYQNPPA